MAPWTVVRDQSLWACHHSVPSSVDKLISCVKFPPGLIGHCVMYSGPSDHGFLGILTPCLQFLFLFLKYMLFFYNKNHQVFPENVKIPVNSDTIWPLILDGDENGIACFSMNLRPWNAIVHCKNGGCSTQLCQISLLHLQTYDFAKDYLKKKPQKFISFCWDFCYDPNVIKKISMFRSYILTTQ